jgi:hypothetical protein
MTSPLKTSAGRLRDVGAARIHEMRGAYDSEGNKQNPRMTYQQIATALGLSVGTIYATCVGRTHRDDVPVGHPLYGKP